MGHPAGCQAVIRWVAGLLACAALAGADTAPLLVYDVDFADQPVDGPLHLVDHDGWEAANRAGSPMLPLRAPRFLRYVSATRTAQVAEHAAGLKRPVVLAFSESEQPHWGPILCFPIPERLRAAGRWRIQLDAAKSSIAISGGIQLWDVGVVQWFEDGTLRCNGTEVGRYAANQAQHLDFLVDPTARTARLTVGGVMAAVQPWLRPAGVFAEIRMHGLMPGGHAEAPSAMILDNLRVELLPGPPAGGDAQGGTRPAEGLAER
jgi:hypothetical protein